MLPCQVSRGRLAVFERWKLIFRSHKIARGNYIWHDTFMPSILINATLMFLGFLMIRYTARSASNHKIFMHDQFLMIKMFMHDHVINTMILILILYLVSDIYSYFMWFSYSHFKENLCTNNADSTSTPTILGLYYFRETSAKLVYNRPRTCRLRFSPEDI